MHFGVILAGGLGSRMAIADMPKQFLPLGDRPMIMHVIDKFLSCGLFDEVYVGVQPAWLPHLADLVGRFAPDGNKRLMLVPGGDDRNATLFNVVERIEMDHGASEEHIVVTHDAVRPFVTLRILEENVRAAEACGACDTVLEATDTIVVSIDGATIHEIPARNTMYQGQTPQSFNMTLLKSLYDRLPINNRAELTDACRILTMQGVPVRLVRGDVSNMKITTLHDYQVAQAMLRAATLD